MSTNPLNSQIAALLSQATDQSQAFGTNGVAVPMDSTLPAGWTADTTLSRSAGDSLFVVYVNNSTQQVVVTFSSAQTVLGPYLSNALDAGASLWNGIQSAAISQLASINDKYAGYSVFANGDGLGGGMAQTFALQKGLDGYGQNSFPIASGSLESMDLNSTSLPSAVAQYQVNNTFSETNVDGDPVTGFFSSPTGVGGTYLSASPQTLESTFPDREKDALDLVTGEGLSTEPSPFAILSGVAGLVADFYQAHSIEAVIGLQQANAAETSGSSIDVQQTADGLTFYDPSHNSSVALQYFVNATGPVCTITDPSGTGSVVANNQLISFAAGTTPDVTVSVDGVVHVELTTTSGSPLTFDLSDSGITTNVDGSPVGFGAGSTGGQVTFIQGPNGTLIATGGGTALTTNQAGQMVSISQATPGGGATADVYNPDNGVLVEHDVINADGSIVKAFYDRTSGAWQGTFNYDNTPAHSLVGQSISPTLAANAFSDVVANAIAGQVIAQFLFKNDMPASLVAQALSKASIDSIVADTNGANVTTTSFAENFVGSLTSMTGGILGANEGVALFSSLGIPSELGSLVGGAIGQIVTNQLAAFVAADVLGVSAADVSTTFGASIAEGTFTAETFASEFVGGFETAGFALAGSELANAILPNGGGLGSEIGGAIGAAIGIYFGGPIGGFLGDFVGSIFGSLFGDGYRGLPFAESNVGLSNNAYTIVNTTVDNNGSPQPSINLATDATQIANSFLSSIGGNAIMHGAWSIGYTGSQFIDFQPGNPYTYYSDANTAVSDEVLALLRNTYITGGNPYMNYMMAVSPANNVTDLANDLNAARDYSLYLADPVAFDIALAEGTAQQYQTWQWEYARAQALGLDKVTPFTAANMGGVTQLGGGSQVASAFTNYNAPANGMVVVTGSNDSINATSDTIVYRAGVTGETLTGDNNTVIGNNIGSITGAHNVINGSNDTANVTNATSVDIVHGSSNDTANSTNSLILGGTGVSMTVNGNGNTIAWDGDSYGGNGLNVAVNGVDNTVILSGSTISFSPGVQGTTVTGSNNTINSISAKFVIDGNSDTIYATSTEVYFKTGTTAEILSGNGNSAIGSTGIGLSILGTNDTVNLSSSTINLASNTAAITINGSNDGIFANAFASFTVNGNNNAVTTSDSAVTFGAGDTTASVTGNNDTISGSSGLSLTASGANDTINLTSATQISLTDGSLGETINGSRNLVLVGTNIGMTLNGELNWIQSNGEANGGTGLNVTFNGVNSTAVLSNSTVTIGSGATIGTTVAGDNDTVNAAANTNFTVHGNGDVVNASSGTVNFGQSTSNASMFGSYETILTGTGVSLAFNGAHDTIGFNGDAGGGNGVSWVIVGSYNAINTAGINDTVHNGAGCTNNTYSMSNGTAILDSGSAADVFNGNNNIFNAAANASFTINGNGNAVNGSSDTVTFGAGDTSATVTGNNDTINGGSGLSLTISGANDTAYISNNSAPINFLQGSSNATVFGSYETILTGTGVSFAFNGAHDTIGFNGDAGGGNGLSWVIVGSYNTINTVGINDTVHNGAGCINNTYSISNGTAILDSGSAADVFNGNNNIFNAAANASFTIDGNGNAVNGSSDTVTFGAGDTSETVTGNSDIINGGSGLSLTASGTNDTINLSNATQISLTDNSLGEIINGSNNLISVGKNISMTLNGQLNWVQSNGETNGGTGLNVTFNGVNSTAVLSNSTVTLGTGASIGTTVAGDDNIVNAAANTNFTVHGVGDVVNGSSDTVSFGAGGPVSLMGSNDTVNAVNGSNLMFTGNADAITASSSTLYLGANTTNASLHGNGDTIHVVAGDSYTISGTGNTVITDTVVNAQNGTTIASYNGANVRVDLTSLAFDTSMTANFVQNSGGYAAQIKVYDHGSLVDTINLQSVQNLGSLTVRPDGSGGTVLIDPPLVSTNEDATQQAFAKAWAQIAGNSTVVSSASHGQEQKFDFAHHADLLTANHAATPWAQQPQLLLEPSQLTTVASTAFVNHATEQFQFSSMPASPPVVDPTAHSMELFSQYAATLVDHHSAYAGLDLSSGPLPDHHQDLVSTHLAPAHDWHL